MEVYVGLVIQGIFGIVGLLIANYLRKTNAYGYMNSLVRAIEQLYPDWSGPEKRAAVIEQFRKKYPSFVISDEYLNIILEAAVKTLKGV